MQHLKVRLSELVKQRLAVYDARKKEMEEHAGIEENVLAGGYGYRQILELVQNGADAVLEGHEQGLTPRGQVGRIAVKLTERSLYVANTGAPLSEDGLEALLNSHLSSKRGNQIGRFGLGFKSLLRLGAVIDVCLGPGEGAIRFDPDRCRRELTTLYGGEKIPGLRIAYWIEPEDLANDRILREFAWARTVVRVELSTVADRELLLKEISEFPAEFLIFLPVSLEMALDTGDTEARTLRVKARGDRITLHDGGKKATWRLFTKNVEVSDESAKADATALHGRTSVPVSWAVRVDKVSHEAGHFWAFFPTKTPTYTTGIINAPWKLGNDRESVISGDYNTFLMREAAQLIASALPELYTKDDPARCLDALPRTPERKNVVARPHRGCAVARSRVSSDPRERRSVS